MEGYKVIKDFSFAEKGDVFTKVEDLNLWELQISEVVSDTETYTSMAFDSSTMEELANKDYVIWYSEEAQESVDECECCKTLNVSLKGVILCRLVREGWKSYVALPPKDSSL